MSNFKHGCSVLLVSFAVPLASASSHMPCAQHASANSALHHLWA